MSKMLRTHQNTIGNLAVALLFVGGCIFLLTGSWDASDSEAAKGCCGGGTTLVAATTGGCCGSINKVSDSGTYKCDCLDTGNEEADCEACFEDPDNVDSECDGDTESQTCHTDCARTFCFDSFCNDTDFETVCSNDTDGKAGCEGTSAGCNKE